MSRVDSCLERLFDLRAKLSFGFVEARMLVNLRDCLPQVSTLIDERRHRISTRDRSPFITVPFGGERKMDAEIGGRIIARELRSLFEPWTGHQNRRRRKQTFLQTPDDAFVLIVAHAEVVSVDDE